MPEFDVFMLFLLAAAALVVAPGPDNIFVLTQSALYGRLAGVMVTLGLCTGLIVHSVAVAFGLAALFAGSDIAFTVVKLLGAGYLLYLAWGAFRAGRSSLATQNEAPPSHGQLYRRGVLMNITNPKVAIFFMAFLPQFADPSLGPLAPQLLVLGGFFIAVAAVLLCGVAFCSGFLGDWLKGSPSAQLVLNRIAGVVFTALAVRLLFATR